MSGIVVGDCGKHDGASLYYERVADVLVLMGWLLSELYSQITSSEAQAWLYGQREGPCRRTDANASQPKLKAALTFDVPTLKRNIPSNVRSCRCSPEVYKSIPFE
jgi:hypothetical protein